MINTQPCTPAEARQTIEALWPLDYSVMLWGPPGCGKSQIVAQLAQDRRAILRDVRLAQKVASDIGGLPALDHDGKRTTFYLPDFLPRENCPGILFLDELPGADEQTRVAAYGLILERRVADWTLPSEWRIVAAGNRPEDGATSCDFGTAMNDRLVHLVIEPTARDWLAWAVDNSICREVMAFIQVRPDLLQGTPEMRRDDHAILPSPRSWERVSRIYAGVRAKRPRELAVCGVVGDGVAQEFLAVAEEIAHMASVEKILATPRGELHRVIPTTIGGLYGLAYALAASVDGARLGAIMEVIDALDVLDGSAHDGLPMADVQALAGSVVLERALKLKLDCGEHPAFISFDAKRRGDRLLERVA